MNCSIRKTTHRVAAISALGAAALFSSAPAASAQDTVGSAISTTISLDFNTHFISYGADVWGAGSSWGDLLFNPSVGFDVTLTENLSLNFGTWLDINDNATSGIANDIQEIDVWVGLVYTMDKWTFSLTYQEWYYAQDVERVIDLGVSYETFLNPSFLIHGRVDKNGDQDTGAVFVFGLSEGFSYGDVDFSVPFDIAFATSDFHGGDSGFAYASIGLGASYPLPIFSESYGLWSLNGGVTFFYTDDDVIPGNPDDKFLIGTVGLSVTF